MKSRVAQSQENGEKKYNVTYREKKQRERDRKKRRQRGLNVLAMGGIFFMVAVLAAAVITLSIVKTDLTNQVSALQDRVDVLDSEYTSLKAQEQSTMTLEEIEDYAKNELGLVRLDSSQEEYVSVEKPDQVEVKSGSSGMDKLVSNFVKSFNAILSFLR